MTSCILRLALCAGLWSCAALAGASQPPAEAARPKAKAACQAGPEQPACKARTLGAAPARAGGDYRPVLLIPAGMAHH